MSYTHYSTSASASRKSSNAPLKSGGPFMIIGFDGSIKDMSPTVHQIVSSPEMKDSNFFSLIHRNHLYPVMRDVADIVCRGKRDAQWLLRLKTAGGTWKFFKADARRSAMHHETITLLLRAV